MPGLEDIVLTTNGILLTRKLPSLIKAGLRSVNISLDTLVPAKFELISRRRGWEKVMEGIDSALAAGFVPLKINCVVTRGVNEEEMVDFVKWTERKAVDVRFIEYMPFGGNKWNDKKIVPYFEMLDIIQRKYPDLIRMQDKPNDTSKASHYFFALIVQHIFSHAARVAGLPSARPYGPVWFHNVHDSKFLRKLQSSAINGGWQLEGKIIAYFVFRTFVLRLPYFCFVNADSYYKKIKKSHF